MTSKKTLRAKSRDVRWVPNPKIYGHILDAVESLKKAEEEYAKCDLEVLEGFFNPEGEEPSHKRKKRKIMDELHDATERYCRIEWFLKNDFRVRWFILRISVPLSMIAGVSVKSIVYGKKEYADERRLLIWLSREMGDIANSEIAAVLDRSEQTTARMYSHCNRLIGYGDSKMNVLLNDFLTLESDICHCLKSYRQHGLV